MVRRVVQDDDRRRMIYGRSRPADADRSAWRASAVLDPCRRRSARQSRQVARARVRPPFVPPADVPPVRFRFRLISTWMRRRAEDTPRDCRSSRRSAALATEMSAACRPRPSAFASPAEFAAHRRRRRRGILRAAAAHGPNCPSAPATAARRWCRRRAARRPTPARSAVPACGRRSPARAWCGSPP